jgi:hypothetical protein
MSFVEREASPGLSSSAKSADEPGVLQGATVPHPNRRYTMSRWGIRLTIVETTGLT